MEAPYGGDLTGGTLRRYLTVGPYWWDLTGGTLLVGPYWWVTGTFFWHCAIHRNYPWQSTPLAEV